MNTEIQHPPEHTPGPWIVDDASVHCKKGLVYKDDRMMTDGSDEVCTIDTSYRRDGLITPTDKANLRLIAASPDLLAACIAMRDGWGKNLTQPMARVNAAIAKATTKK